MIIIFKLLIFQSNVGGTCVCVVLGVSIEVPSAKKLGRKSGKSFHGSSAFNISCLVFHQILFDVYVGNIHIPLSMSYEAGSPVRSRPSSVGGAISSFAGRKSVQELWQKKSMKNGGLSCHILFIVEGHVTDIVCLELTSFVFIFARSVHGHQEKSYGESYGRRSMGRSLTQIGIRHID